MIEKVAPQREDDWCIVRWHDGDLLIRREYQWFAHAKNYTYKWKYVAKNLTAQQAQEFSFLFD
jgi:hypothetical protein